MCQVLVVNAKVDGIYLYPGEGVGHWVFLPWYVLECASKFCDGGEVSLLTG